MDSNDVVPIQFDLLKNQMAATPSDIHDHGHNSTPHHHHDDELRDQHHQNQEPEKEDGQRSSEIIPDVIDTPNSKEHKTSPSSTLEGLTSNELAENDDIMDDENDGFKTPTSLEHRIPVPTQCPPAPKVPLGKRKESPSQSPSVTVVDFTEEQLQAMFWQPCIPNLYGKIKKAKPPAAPAEPGSADVANYP